MWFSSICILPKNFGHTASAIHVVCTVICGIQEVHVVFVGLLSRCLHNIADKIHWQYRSSWDRSSNSTARSRVGIHARHSRIKGFYLGHLLVTLLTMYKLQTWRHFLCLLEWRHSWDEKWLTGSSKGLPWSWSGVLKTGYFHFNIFRSKILASVGFQLWMSHN